MQHPVDCIAVNSAIQNFVGTLVLCLQHHVHSGCKRTKIRECEIMQQCVAVLDTCTYTTSCLLLTIRIAVGYQEFNHFIHGAHEENETQLCHCHGDDAPEKNWGTD